MSSKFSLPFCDYYQVFSLKFQCIFGALKLFYVYKNIMNNGNNYNSHSDIKYYE